MQHANKEDLLHALEQLLIVIPDEQHWTQGAGARRSDGSKCEYDSHDAACFCIHGARMKVCGEHLGWETPLSLEVSRQLAFTIRRQMHKSCAHLKRTEWWSIVQRFNDRKKRTYLEVRNLIERTLKHVESHEIRLLAVRRFAA